VTKHIAVQYSQYYRLETRK